MLVGANAPGMAATYDYYPEGGRAWKQVNGVTMLYLELDGIELGGLRFRLHPEGTHHPRLGHQRCGGSHPQPNRRPDPPAAQPPGQRHLAETTILARWLAKAACNVDSLH
ncbi:hypothetical protein [Niveispirillum cyanobacteriorum]|uniref:hypothetical protein n=1 Tax=Niveispirillum cyanobacteriorum TaxID=1612173 RepID=UPI001319E69A|nr:hypothetical protein [Niveispirillum cyanobacteriorum]GGE63836.1 hypothetical protein GCM10011317_21520 [Niveispirillum cyanobacteriorum]